MKPMSPMKPMRPMRPMGPVEPMKPMSPSPFSRHFVRSGEADQVLMTPGSKSGMQNFTQSCAASKSCNLVCLRDQTRNTALALSTLFAALSFEPVVFMTRRLSLSCWHILLGICAWLLVVTCCLCECDLICFLLLPFSDCSLGLLGSLRIVLLNLVAQWFVPFALLCVAIMHVYRKLKVRRCSHFVVLRKALVPDLLGGTGLGDIGSKAWFDNIMKGLNARHLQPPMQQIRMLAQDEATLRRLQKCESLKHQLDIICGAAYKAKLSWQKVVKSPADSSVATAATPATPPPLPEVHTWRLRTRDWKVCKPAANDGEPVSGERHDAFRTQADGDPLTHLWSRKFGAYFVSAVGATRIVRSVPAHAPPAGLFTLVTLEPTARSEVQPVETLVVFPDNSHHMHKVFLTHLGTEKLSASAWKTVSLASVDSVEVLLEWWKDLTDGDALAAFDGFVKLATSPTDPVTDPVANKGKAKGKGKTKYVKQPHRLSDTLVANLNSQVSRMLGDPSGQKLGTWKASGHNVKADIIRVSVRLPKVDAVNWLKAGTQHHAILVRDIHDIPEAKDLCCVWISPGCPVMEGSAAQTQQSLKLYLASFAHSWSVVRTPYRWGIRIHKDHEREVKAIVQPHAVFVPANHFKYRIANVPKSLDPAVLVATLTADGFKPYLVSSSKGVVTIAAPSAPADIVFAIPELGCTLLLQLLPGTAGSRLHPVQTRHTEDSSPRRKSRRGDADNASLPRELDGGDTRGGAKGVLSANPCGPLDDSCQVAFPPLPNAPASPLQSVSVPTDFEPGILPNLGNTCFAAVTVRCLAHIVTKSNLSLSSIQDLSLRCLLADLSPTQWKLFIKHHHLEQGQQQDAALWLQHWLDSESALRSLVSVILNSVGCLADTSVVAAVHSCGGPQAQSFPRGPPPPGCG